MKELDEVRKLFLSEVDEETRVENEQKIEEWQTGLRTNEVMAEWRDHDITREIANRTKESYKDISLQLALNRSLTQEQRHTLWGRQDACLFILSLTEVDARGRIKQIHKDIKAALAATN